MSSGKIRLPEASTLAGLYHTTRGNCIAIRLKSRPLVADRMILVTARALLRFRETAGELFEDNQTFH